MVQHVDAFRIDLHLVVITAQRVVSRDLNTFIDEPDADGVPRHTTPRDNREIVASGLQPGLPQQKPFVFHVAQARTDKPMLKVTAVYDVECMARLET